LALKERACRFRDFHVLRGRRFFFGWAAPKKNEKSSAFLSATASWLVGKNLIKARSFQAATFRFAPPQSEQDAASALCQLLSRLGQGLFKNSNHTNN